MSGRELGVHSAALLRSAASPNDAAVQPPGRSLLAEKVQPTLLAPTAFRATTNPIRGEITPTMAFRIEFISLSVDSQMPEAADGEPAAAEQNDDNGLQNEFPSEEQCDVSSIFD